MPQPITITASTTSIYVPPTPPVYLQATGGATSAQFFYDATGAYVAPQVAQIFTGSAATGSVVVSSYTQPQITMRNVLQTPGAQRLLARPPPPLTPEAQAQRDREARRCYRAERRANTKAETTLLKLMSRSQRLTWINARYFDVVVGPRTYRIREGLVGNVTLLDAQGKATARYCCHPDMDVPLADVALSQWMMLVHDEMRFLGLANKLSLRERFAVPEFVGARGAHGEVETPIVVPERRTADEFQQAMELARAAGF